MAQPAGAATAPLPPTDDSRIREMADMFHLMGDPTRLAVLLSCLGAPVPVGEIAARVGASPSLVSHHLRLLRAARILRAERRGRQVFYTAADDHIRTVLNDMCAHAAERDEAATP